MSEPFTKVPTDESLIRDYATLDDLIGDFQPGNYNPTCNQAQQLVECAVRAAFRWLQLNPTALLKPPEWKPTPKGFALSTILGEYRAFKDDDGFYWMWPKIRECESCIKVDSLEAAKAACFAHFRAAIREAFQ